MAMVVGIGGVFLKATDPAALCKWYAKHLGAQRSLDGAFAFAFASRQDARMTYLPLFPAPHKNTSAKANRVRCRKAMVNFRVDD